MRQFLTLLLIIAAIWGGKQLYSYWESVKAKKEAEDRGGAPPPTPAGSAVLPGLPAHLEASLQAAQKQGAPGLKSWLNLNRRYVSDPRLAAIELDYVLLISSTNPQEARRLFTVIKQRTPTNSPVYPRIKRLEKTYQ